MSTRQHLYNSYAPPPIKFVSGSGIRLVDADGNSYIDCAAGIAVTALGHGHPHLVETLKTAADGIWHLSNLFDIPGQERLAERLCAETFADRVFFANSGAEAMECAIKTARKFHYANGNPERVEIITFEGAFHGRTIATIAAGGQEKYLEGFGPKAPGFVQVGFGDHDGLKRAVNENTAAILVEPIQGEGGVREVPGQCLRGLRELCDEHGILLIYDEIQTGMGRSGKLFAYQKHDAPPDIMASAKGLGGGFPVGACLATEEAAAGMVLGSHGSTFGGNPLAMAVANAVLDVMLEDGFLEDVARRASLFQQMLSEVLDTFPDLLEDVRGSGFLLAMKAKVPNTDVVNALREERLLVAGGGDNVVRIVPPLVVTEADMREIRDTMIAGLTKLREAGK